MDDVGLVKAPRICKMEREDNGYGFNLHGEKGVVGQYISAVDPGLWDLYFTLSNSTEFITLLYDLEVSTRASNITAINIV